MNNRGQSESLGFAIVFGVVLLMVLLSAAAGVPGLLNLEHNQQVRNMERGFTVFADSTDTLVQNEAPRREPRIRLSGGQLSVGDPATITIDANNISEFDVRPLEYRSPENDTISYLNGGVIRGDEDGAVMLRTPEFIATGDQLVFPIIRLQTTQGGVGGTTTVALATTRTAADIYLDDNTDSPVTINISSAHAAAWQSLEDDYSELSCSGTEPVSCEIDTDRVVITRVDIALRFK